MCILSCFAVLLVMGMTPQNVSSIVATAETGAAETTEYEAAETSESSGASKAIKITGFLAIFTVVCAGTAYLVMRPSLKKLKSVREAQESQDKTE